MSPIAKDLAYSNEALSYRRQMNSKKITNLSTNFRGQQQQLSSKVDSNLNNRDKTLSHFAIKQSEQVSSEQEAYQIFTAQHSPNKNQNNQEINLAVGASTVYQKVSNSSNRYNEGDQYDDAQVSNYRESGLKSDFQASVDSSQQFDMKENQGGIFPKKGYRSKTAIRIRPQQQAEIEIKNDDIKAQAQTQDSQETTKRLENQEQAKKNLILQQANYLIELLPKKGSRERFSQSGHDVGIGAPDLDNELNSQETNPNEIFQYAQLQEYEMQQFELQKEQEALIQSQFDLEKQKKEKEDKKMNDLKLVVALIEEDFEMLDMKENHNFNNQWFGQNQQKGKKRRATQKNLSLEINQEQINLKFKRKNKSGLGKRQEMLIAQDNEHESSSESEEIYTCLTLQNIEFLHNFLDNLLLKQQKAFRITEKGLQEHRRRHVPNFALVRNQNLKPCNLTQTEQKVYNRVEKTQVIHNELFNYMLRLKNLGQQRYIKPERRPILNVSTLIKEPEQSLKKIKKLLNQLRAKSQKQREQDLHQHYLHLLQMQDELKARKENQKAPDGARQNSQHEISTRHDITANLGRFDAKNAALHNVKLDLLQNTKISDSNLVQTESIASQTQKSMKQFLEGSLGRIKQGTYIIDPRIKGDLIGSQSLSREKFYTESHKVENPQITQALSQDIYKVSEQSLLKDKNKASNLNQQDQVKKQLNKDSAEELAQINSNFRQNDGPATKIGIDEIIISAKYKIYSNRYAGAHEFGNRNNTPILPAPLVSQTPESLSNMKQRYINTKYLSNTSEVKKISKNKKNGTQRKSNESSDAVHSVTKPNSLQYLNLNDYENKPIWPQSLGRKGTTPIQNNENYSEALIQGIRGDSFNQLSIDDTKTYKTSELDQMEQEAMQKKDQMKLMDVSLKKNLKMMRREMQSATKQANKKAKKAHQQRQQAQTAQQKHRDFSQNSLKYREGKLEIREKNFKPEISYNQHDSSQQFLYSDNYRSYLAQYPDLFRGSFAQSDNRTANSSTTIDKYQIRLKNELNYPQKKIILNNRGFHSRDSLRSGEVLIFQNKPLWIVPTQKKPLLAQQRLPNQKGCLAMQTTQNSSQEKTQIPNQSHYYKSIRSHQTKQDQLAIDQRYAINLQSQIDKYYDGELKEDDFLQNGQLKLTRQSIHSGVESTGYGSRFHKERSKNQLLQGLESTTINSAVGEKPLLQNEKIVFIQNAALNSDIQLQDWTGSQTLKTKKNEKFELLKKQQNRRVSSYVVLDNNSTAIGASNYESTEAFIDTNGFGVFGEKKLNSLQKKNMCRTGFPGRRLVSRERKGKDNLKDHKRDSRSPLILMIEPQQLQPSRVQTQYQKQRFPIKKTQQVNILGLKPEYEQNTRTRSFGQKFYISGTMLPPSKQQMLTKTDFYEEKNHKENDDNCSTEYEADKRHVADQNTMTVSYQNIQEKSLHEEMTTILPIQKQNSSIQNFGMNEFDSIQIQGSDYGQSGTSPKQVIRKKVEISIEKRSVGSSLDKAAATNDFAEIDAISEHILFLSDRDDQIQTQKLSIRSFYQDKFLMACESKANATGQNKKKSTEISTDDRYKGRKQSLQQGKTDQNQVKEPQSTGIKSQNMTLQATSNHEPKKKESQKALYSNKMVKIPASSPSSYIITSSFQSEQQKTGETICAKRNNPIPSGKKSSPSVHVISSKIPQTKLQDLNSKFNIMVISSSTDTLKNKDN